MKRLHVNILVKDLQKSIDFYSALFASEPTKQKADYAKWMLDDPRVNFAITHRPLGGSGIEHLGIEAENPEELQELYQRVDKAQMSMKDEGETVCCYAKSTKGWVDDPQKVSWELFHTSGDAETFYGGDEACCNPAEAAADAACCEPVAKVVEKASGACC